MNKFFKSVLLLIALVLLGAGYVFAQEAMPSPSPSSIPALDGVASFIDKISALLGNYATVIGTVLMVLWTVAKRISTEKAPKIVKMVQAVFDGVAKILLSIGALFAKVSSFLSEMMKSDGIGGVK